jgi:sugar phosphate isomerase/epimerase
MSEVTTFNWTIDADLAGYGRHGFPGIELWLNKVARNGAEYDLMPSGELSDVTIDELVGALDGAGLDAASDVCAGALTEPDDDTWKRRVAHLRFTVRFAARVGASCVLVCPGDLLGATRPAAIERTDRAARGSRGRPRSLRRSRDRPLRPIHTDFVNTLPQALEIVAAVGDPRRLHGHVCVARRSGRGS